MPTVTKKRMSIAGSKRKAEAAKEASAKGSKKPKIESPRDRAQAPKSTGTAVKSMKAPIEQVSSDDDFEGFSEDGGVKLDNDEDANHSEDAVQHEEFQGLHSERVKAAGQGAGPNGTMFFHIQVPTSI
jgi:hypothetical protein